MKTVWTEFEKEVLAVLNFNNDTFQEEGYDYWSGEMWMHGDTPSPKEFDELYGLEFREIEQYGGEGQGEEYWTVYEFSNMNGDTAYVKFEGWYASHHGSEFQELYLVRPKEVVKTEWIRYNQN